ncbi:MAG: XVIPCD domain-containing protein [Stenotrophomonas sp.]
MALAVVRNDNLPGQVANAYAQSAASNQNDRNPKLQNHVLTEREWEQFGQTLLDRDLERRIYWLGTGQRELALNLPGRDVQVAHDKAFAEHGLDPNCWTPRVLLEATRKNLSEDAAENVWKEMLNNDKLGTARAWSTTGHAYAAMPFGPATAYIATLGGYELAMAHQALPTRDPNVIGVRGAFHAYDEKAGTWHFHPEGGIPMRERNPRILEQLNDTRELRLERNQKAIEFHQDDPYRRRIETPKVVLNDHPSEQHTRLAGLRPGDEHYALSQQIREHVAMLDNKHGRTFDETSERLAASLTALAVENKLDRVDHVVLSEATPNGPAGRNVFVVQGDLRDPAHSRAAMATELATQTPVERSLQQLQEVSVGLLHKAVTLPADPQAHDGPARENQSQSMRMG